MSRDYKHAGTRSKRSARSSKGRGWPLFFAGLGAGFGVALAVFLVQRSPQLFSTRHRAAAPPPVSAPAHPAQAAKPEKKPAATPKPHFDFYTILPEMEVKVPDADLYGDRKKESPADAGPGIFYLQVGSFRQFDEADRAKAKLALIGISADIQRVVMNSHDTWYRVRVGPFKDLKSSDATRRRLTENGMDFMVLRIKQPRQPAESAADKAAE